MKRQEFAARVWSKLIRHEKAEGLLPRGARVAAAVSGGPDSVCLAHYLAQRARPLGLTVTLVHVHHGIRGKAADRDEAFVVKLARDLGLAVDVRRVDARARAALRRKGLEDAARELRYAELARGPWELVATGHHLDDQAETLLLHLLRGTKLSALGGIAPRRPLTKGASVIRPLLPLTRAEVLLYLNKHGLRHRVDATNADESLQRNWVRRKVLPLLLRRQPRLREHLSLLASQVRTLTTR